MKRETVETKKKDENILKIEGHAGKGAKSSEPEVLRDVFYRWTKGWTSNSLFPLRVFVSAVGDAQPWWVYYCVFLFVSVVFQWLLV